MFAELGASRCNLPTVVARADKVNLDRVEEVVNELPLCSEYTEHRKLPATMKNRTACPMFQNFILG